jgi:Ca2+-binding EF-hand superfamily protein
MKFSEKRADDLFNRSNTDGDTTISVQEFIAIYKEEIHKAAEKRKKLIENLIRIRKRNKGCCFIITRFFTGSDVKQFSN